jgi:hypothetical protein
LFILVWSTAVVGCYGATPPSFTVQPYVPVNVARAATADALYFVVPMLNVTPDCNV